MMYHLHLFLLWLFVLLSFLVPCDGQEHVLLSQIPRWVSLQFGGTVKVKCFQNNTDHSWMYWYQQKAADQQLKLIGMLTKGSSAPTLEDGFNNNKFVIQPEEEKHCSLQINELKPEDTAMYFCASRTGGGYEQHFGTGTRLTVLEKGKKSSPPKVRIFAPSAQELQEKKKATIVCLVTDFYPDHINLTWSVNGEERSEGVKTEDQDLKKLETTYSLISRLRITSKEWYNPNNNFQCRVDFYNETGKATYDDAITGVDCVGDTAAAKERYLRDANFGKLVYILLIFKSALYAAFVMSLKLSKKQMP